MTGYQRAIYGIEKTYPGTGVCNIGGMISLAPGTDEGALIAAVKCAILHIPAMRLRLSSDGKLYVSDEVQETEISEFDGDLEKKAQEIISEPFELYDRPLYAFFILKTPDGDIGIMKLHHLIGDHMAIHAFFRRIDRLMAGAETRIREIYRGSHVPSGAAEHYRERLKDHDIAPLFAYPKSIEAGVVKRDLRQSVEITEFCHESGIKPLSILTAAIAVYMKKTHGRDRFIIGNTVMNRDRHTLYSFGLYANTLPLFIDGAGSFMDALRLADSEIAASAEFCSYPLTDMLAENGITERCFDIAVNYFGTGMKVHSRLGGIRKLYNGFCELPIRLHMIHTRDGFSIEAEYIKELFSADFINGFISSLEQIIDCGINNKPPAAVSCEDMIAYEELNSAPCIEADTTVSRLFSAYANAHPEETAYIYGGEAVSYKDTLAMAKVIANKISGCCAVAIACGRCRYLIPAMLGALMSGAAYMPVAPGRQLPACCDKLLSTSEYNTDGAICLDKLDYSEVEYDDVSTSDGIAYYMNTSGSTGEPKTVLIKNRSLYIRLKWMHDKYGLNRHVLQKAALTFDVSGWELLCCAFGGTVVLMRDGEERSPDKIAEYINKYRIELIHFVPSMLRAFFAVPRGCESLADIVSSGEALTASDAQLVERQLPGTRLHDLYGPTECTIDVSYHDCIPGEIEIPIGRPVYNTRLYIVNGENELMPREVDGELIVCGDLVGAGYLGGGGGYTEFNGENAYRTGDICRLGFNGEIYYTGRADREVKINGKRVSLDGLEALAMRIAGVSASAAAEDGGRIYLFVKTKRSVEDVRAALGGLTDRLPSYIFCVEEMPVTSAGKLDRKALLAITKKDRSDAEPPRTNAEQDIQTAVLAELNTGGEIYERLDVNEDIFNAGISSLSVLMLEKRLRDMGYDITAQDIYRGRSVRAIAGCAPREGLVYLKQKDNGRVLCCFPYAGGAPQAFSGIADAFDGTVVGIDYSYFGERASVEHIAEYTAKRLDGEIFLVSACIGSVFLMETAHALESRGRCVCGAYIIASLPPKMSRLGNPWRRLPKAAVTRLLSRMGGRSLPKQLPLDGFMRDTDRYFAYDKKRRLNTKAFIAYAEDDRFTSGSRRRREGWGRFFTNEPVISYFTKGGHYFFETERDIMKRMEVRENA